MDAESTEAIAALKSDINEMRKSLIVFAESTTKMCALLRERLDLMNRRMNSIQTDLSDFRTHVDQKFAEADIKAEERMKIGFVGQSVSLVNFPV